uniref:Inter-alpha-trypsin inhibitor heavy chain family member 6 n=1 Tax=Electrophorus electricus TaxID=8005 RepID=A0A4W4HP79_ELEEL
NSLGAISLCLCLCFASHIEKHNSSVGVENILSTWSFKSVGLGTKITRLKITDYHVHCTVMSRYALTTVESTVWNQFHLTKEAAFEVDLPASAFISNFTITSGGKVYVAQVKERAAARKFYDAAKKHGKIAGLVATKSRETEKFRVVVSMPPAIHMSFSISYEELLTRRLGRYELALGLRPGQPVQNLSVDITIAEQSGISFMKVLPLRTSRLLSMPPSTQVQQNPYCAHIHYSPTLEQQRNLSPKGLNADFVIQYDVELKDLMGDIQVLDGYFVHYFAPRALPVVSKDVIFVIDISGSMIGNKIKQTKAAMSTILDELREGDYFNLITFSDKVHTWKKGRTVQATKQNIQEAKEFVRKISAEGWTNINAALLSAAHLVNPSSSSSASHSLSPRRVPMIIFLTDGEATIGVTAQDAILHNAQSALGSVSLFGLAFGDDADFPLLKRLALENRGIARMVFEDADAALQLKGFYDEVASPLLSDIQLSYLEDQAYDVTRVLFPNYFQGSELVVTGKIKSGVQEMQVSLTANDSKQKLKVESKARLAKSKGNETATFLDCKGSLGGIYSFVQRLWAYFTIKELLLAKINSTDSLAQQLLAEKATNLSLKYNFVTPVTSLVVVKPDTDKYPTSISSIPTSPVTTTTESVMTNTVSPGKHLPPSSLKSTTTLLPSTNKTISAKISSKASTTMSTMLMDGDPHFFVKLPNLQQNLCFTVDGRANDVLRLLEDPEKGIIVEGHLILAPTKRGVEEHTRTFFDKITIKIAKGGISVTLMIDSVVVKGEGLHSLPTTQQGSVTYLDLKIVLDGHQSCWIDFGKGMLFLVVFHRYSHPSYYQMEHLGFYIADGEGLSSLTQGLLGMLHFLIFLVCFTVHGAGFHHAQTSKNTSLAMGLLMKGNQHIPVTLQDKNLKITPSKRLLAQCWVVPKVEVERLLGHSYESYLVDHL